MLLALALLIYAFKIVRPFFFAPDSSLSFYDFFPYHLNLHVYLGIFAFIFFSIYLPSKLSKQSLFVGHILNLIVSGLLSRFRAHGSYDSDESHYMRAIRDCASYVGDESHPMLAPHQIFLKCSRLEEHFT